MHVEISREMCLIYHIIELYGAQDLMVLDGSIRTSAKRFVKVNDTDRL